MLSDPRDRGAYRIAIAALGLAVAVSLAGICWIATSHVEKHLLVPHLEKGVVLTVSYSAQAGVGHIPVELWFAVGALGGVLVGVLMPFSLRALDRDEPAWWSIAGGVVLVIVFAGVVVGGVVANSLPLYALAATIAGILLGLPIPSPGRRGR